jgi:TolB-like protein/tetratricopeptide (TPR) repeat protein
MSLRAHDFRTETTRVQVGAFADLRGSAGKLSVMNESDNEWMRSIRFGVFEVDLRSGELRKQGIRVRLQDQPFQILVLMLNRPGEVITRDEIRRRLWPDGTFVDFEHSLNAAVKRLRAALGDSAESPRFVETLHRRGYRFIAPVDGILPARETTSERVSEVDNSTSRKCRILVLPFVNLSTQSEQEYFSDGLTEEMIAQLGRAHPRRLGVIARTSSMLFKRAGKTVAEIGREMDVAYVLEGSVRCDAGRVRVTAQLIETKGQTHLWADSYERSFQDSLTVQSEVAGRIARALASELLPTDSGALIHLGTSHTDAYHTYLKGRYHWNMPGDEGLEKAIEYYEKAVALDPAFAQAHAALARAHVARSDWSHKPGRLVLEEARASALRALELDSQSVEGHLALADVRKRVDWDWPAAERGYRTALELNPSSDAAHRSYGVFLAALGRHDEAIAEAERAVELDPLCLTVNSSAAWVCYTARQYDRGIAWCRHTLELRPGFVMARRFLAAAYLQTGRIQEAIAELEETIRHSGPEPVLVAWLAHARAIEGRRAESLAGLQQLRELAAKRYVSAYQTSLVYVGLGDVDGAFASLEQACADRASGLVNLCVEPRLDPIRADPRYGVLVERLGLPTPRQT